MQIIDYVAPSAPKGSQAKSILVFGNTREHKDKLKSLGGSYSGGYTVKGKKTPGWIFKKSDEDAIKAVRKFVKNANESSNNTSSSEETPKRKVKRAKSSSSSEAPVKKSVQKKSRKPVSSTSSSEEPPKRKVKRAKSSSSSSEEHVKKSRKPLSSSSSEEELISKLANVSLKKKYTYKDLSTITDFQVLYYLISREIAPKENINGRRLQMYQHLADDDKITKEFTKLIKSKLYAKVFMKSDEDLIRESLKTDEVLSVESLLEKTRDDVVLLETLRKQ